MPIHFPCRRCATLLSALIVLAATSSALTDDAEARAILDKAIKAAGGEASLAKLKAVTLKMKAKVVQDEKEGTISGDLSFSELWTRFGSKSRWSMRE